LGGACGSVEDELGVDITARFLDPEGGHSQTKVTGPDGGSGHTQ